MASPDYTPEDYSIGNQTSSSTSGGYVPTDYSIQGTTSQPTQSVTPDDNFQQVVPEPNPVYRFEKGTYSQDDLVQDKYYYTVVLPYMEDRFGIDEFRDYSKEDVVNKYLNNMRGFGGVGNSVRSIAELSYLNNMKEDEGRLAIAGSAYSLYEGMANITSGETTWSEKAEIVGDYLREGIFDPVNLLGGLAGKVVAGAGTKVIMKTAQQAAKNAYLKQFAKTGSKESAMKVAEKTFMKEAQKVQAKSSAELVTRQKLAGTLKPKLIEIGVVTGVDSVAAATSALAWESGLVRTEVKEDISWGNVGLTAIGSMVFGGTQGVAQTLLRGKKDVNLIPGLNISKTKELGLAQVKRPEADEFEGFGSIENMIVTLKDVKPDSKLKGKKVFKRKTVTDSFQKKVAEGTSIHGRAWTGDDDRDFWQVFILGYKEEGEDGKLLVKGMAHLMAEQGYVFVKKSPDDKITNFMADVIKKSDPQMIGKFIKDFERITGRKVPKLKKTGTRGKVFDVNNFAKSLANTMSNNAKVMNAASQAAKILSLDSKELVDFKDYAEAILTTGIRQAKPGIVGKTISEGVEKFGLEGLTIQNKIIRLLVSAPSTSFLNLVGWGSATGLNTVSDIGQAIIYGGYGSLNKIISRKDGTDSLRVAQELLRANRQRVRNLLDPTMTYEAFQSMTLFDPKSMRDLTEVISGGVRNSNKAIRDSGYDPRANMIDSGLENTVDFIQNISLVKAQDQFTKSQEFMYQIDKNLRISFKGEDGKGLGFADFFANKDVAKMVNSKQYKESMAKAIYETERAIFSKSFKDKSGIGKVASIVEDARKIPLVGLYVPFGRFFNNTMAFMSDTTGMSVAFKLLGQGYKKPGQDRTFTELATRASVGWGLMITLAQNEQYYSEMGLDSFQRIDETTGAVITEKYNFPYSHLKGAARIMSYWTNPIWETVAGKTNPLGKGPPEKEIEQIVSTLGLNQLTRALDQQIEGLGDAFKKGLAGDVSMIGKFSQVVGGAVSQGASGSTRFIDPYNATVGLLMGKDEIKIDRNQNSKMMNNSLRYMDNILASILSKETREGMGMSVGEDYTATGGAERTDASRNLGMREIYLSDTKKVLNMIGKPLWDVDARTSMAYTGADNSYNRMFNDISEIKFSRLLRDPLFREGPKRKDNNPRLLEYRKGKVADILNQARGHTKTFMALGYDETNPDDRVFSKLIDIADGFNLSEIDYGMKALSSGEDALWSPNTDVGDLDYMKLLRLENYLEFREAVEDRGF